MMMIQAMSHSCSNVTLMTLFDARSALAMIWSSTLIMYLTFTHLSSSHQPSALLFLDITLSIKGDKLQKSALLGN